MADTPSQTERPLIALVDDEKEITQIIAEELSSDYDAVQFNQPRQFVEAIKSRAINPAVLVIDLKMPGMTGLEVLRELSELGVSIPTVMFSGYLDKQDAMTAVELGVLHMIEKPIDLNMVHEIVNESLVDWDLMRIRNEIRENIKEVRAIYSTVREAIADHVPQEVGDKIFVTQSGGNKIKVDELLMTLDEKLAFLLREEVLLVKLKQKQVRRVLEKQGYRAS